MSVRVTLNIRGTCFETYESTLQRFPNTLLGNPMLLEPYFNAEKNEYFFDRSQYIFDTILFFYQSGGILAKPDYIDEDEFQEELRFFGILKDQSPINLPKTQKLRLRQHLWLLLEFPKSSIFAKIIARLSVIMIVISTVTYCMETTIDDLFQPAKNKRKPKIIGSLRPDSFWYVLETFYAAWFSLEYSLRIVSNPNKISFLLSVLGFVDLLAIIPYICLVSGKLDHSEAATRTMRFLQIFRILKLSRYSKTLQLLGKSLYYCKGQISLLLVFFFINCLACGSILYWVERTMLPTPSASLMDTMWLCIISMTTVGYGDIVPQTSLGKLAGAVTILVGIVVLFHIFIPVYLSYFALLYEISILQSLEKSENERQPESKQEEDIKRHRRMSISSSVRKSRASIAMNRSPSITAHESISPGRKPSACAKEETVMRKVKYDYLRRLSSSESPLTASQKSLEQNSVDAPFQSRKGSLLRSFFDTPSELAETEDYPSVFVETATEQRRPKPVLKRRRKAVFEQPHIQPEAIQDHERLITNRDKRSVSFSDERSKKASVSSNSGSFEFQRGRTNTVHGFGLTRQGEIAKEDHELEHL